MTPDALDRLFADLNDHELCNAWYLAIANSRSSLRQRQIDEMPHAWHVIWNVWGHLGLWKNEGMGCLWGCDQDDLQFFIESLAEINEQPASEHISASLDAMDRTRLLDERFLLSDEFAQAAKHWDRNNEFYYYSIDRSLASFARKHRSGALPLFHEIQSIKATDTNCS